jgi:hypothetical protein
MTTRDEGHGRAVTPTRSEAAAKVRHHRKQGEGDQVKRGETVKTSRTGLVRTISRPATEADGLRIKQDGNRFSVTFDTDMSITLLEGLRGVLMTTCPPETWPTIKTQVRFKDSTVKDCVFHAYPRDEITLSKSVADALGQINAIERYLKIFRKAPEHELRGRGGWLIEKSLNLAFQIWDIVLLDHEGAIDNSLRFNERTLLRNSAKTRQRSHLQKKADTIWAQHPDWSASRVAEELFPDNDAKARRNTARRQIKKPSPQIK